MGIFEEIVKIFSSQNNGNHTVSAPRRGTGNAAGHTAYKFAPQHQPVRKQPAQSSSSSGAGAANWFNGIGSSSASSRNDNITVYSLKGTPMSLTASDCKASGGEGTVYAIPGKPDVLVKIYKDELLKNPVKRAEIEKRIFDMIAISKDINTESFAWPRAAVCNSRKEVIGFAMNKCQGISLQALSGVKSISRNFPGWTRRELALAAKDFLKKIQYLASKNILVNDFNPANFLVDQECNVSFIDCDSYQVPDEKGNADITKTFFASHVAPELLENPALLAKPRNIHHVEFGAALTVFNILMCGLHPYSYFDSKNNSACGTPDENLRRGRCPLGRGSHCKMPVGNWYNLWSYLTYKLKDSFIQTFRDGHKKPSERVPLESFNANIDELLYIMKKDPRRLDLNPATPKPQAESSNSGNYTFTMNF